MAMVASTPAAATLGGWGRVQTAVTVELLSFTGPGSENCCDVVVDNASSWKTELYDRATSEHIKFLYAVVTTKDAEGDLKLARMCRLVEEAGLHHHTYDAKSGAPYRIRGSCEDSGFRPSRP